jgi:hypothetical protein
LSAKTLIARACPGETRKVSRYFSGFAFELCPDTHGNAAVRNYEAMKTIIYAQLNPTKTLQQIVNDRDLYRLLTIGALLVACCL